MTAVATLSFLSTLSTAVASNELHGWSPYSPIPKSSKPSVSCGEVLTEDTFLEGNLYCPGGSDDFFEPSFALRVTNGATLDCQGSGIFGNFLGVSGSEFSCGVIVEEGGIMKNCNVESLYFGVCLGLGKTTVKGSTITDYSLGIFALTVDQLNFLLGTTGSTYDDVEPHHTIDDVESVGNSFGIAVRSDSPPLTSIDVIECYLGSNSGFGIGFFGTMGRLIVRDTTISGGGIGVRTRAASTTLIRVNIVDNTVDNNDAGIRVDGGSTVIRDSFVYRSGGDNLSIASGEVSLFNVQLCGAGTFDIDNNGGSIVRFSDVTCETQDGAPGVCMGGCDEDGTAAAVQCKTDVPWWVVYRGREHYYCGYERYP